MDYQNLVVEVDGPVAVVTINRPKVLNALDGPTVRELGRAMSQLGSDHAVRAVILTGSGDKAFVAGADISFMRGLTPLEAKEFARQGHAVFTSMENLPVPVIAAVNGFALGGGCELALACDIRVASENAQFGQPEVSLGIIAGFGGSQRLPRLVGPGLAKEILFTGDRYDAVRAREIGLVNYVVPREELLAFCRDLAGRIAQRGPAAVGLTKEAVNQGLQMDLASALGLESDLFALSFATGDRLEGMDAFLQKRKPAFSGK
ncbi:MAG TPA: enoyl-CoA hydratase-related protein [Spirochaetia bacterium]|nr:enoyl-CoA hydratase-related protein [Spirochaetia bacterium]